MQHVNPPHHPLGTYDAGQLSALASTLKPVALRHLTSGHHVAQLLAKQALWSLSRAHPRAAALAAALPGVMKALVPALNLNNQWNSFQCTLFAVRRCVPVTGPVRQLARPHFAFMDGRPEHERIH